jgi:hypothetical protein
MKATAYDQILPEILAIIEQYGGVRLLFDLTEFKGEAMSAWGPIFRVGKGFGKKILRMTIIGEKVWEQPLAGLAVPYWAKEGKIFPVEPIDEAWVWLKGTP